MDTLREDLHKFWQRCGHLKPPLELVTLAAKGPAKFYPVDDGEGGGELFTDNASAHEYLHLEEGRRMIRCTSTIELGYDAIHAPGKRMPPPPQPPAAAAMTRAYGAGAGPSGAGPSAQEAPSERRETPTHGNLARQVRSPTPDTSSECSDRSTIEAASSPASTSSQTWLSGDDVAKLQHVSSLTVFMVRCADTRRDGARRDGPVLFQLGRCYDRRGLSCHNDISASVMRQYDKTIACAQNDWHLPLGGQAEGKSKNLKEAIIGLAYEGVVRFDTRVHRCVALLKHNVESGTAHVLCCREIPSAKPMYCIFEDSSRPSEDDTLLFTDDYLQNERRKLTGLTYVTKLRSPPWVAKVLLLLEKRLRAPTSAAVVEEEREAHMTHRPEHTDDGVEDMRHDAVNRFIQALSPGSPHSHHESDDTSAATCASPEHSVCSAETQAFQEHSQSARQAARERFHGVARMQRGGDPTEQPSLRPWTACTSSPHKARLAVNVSVHGASPFARDAWGGAPCTSWEAQQSSRQREPGWEANVAEQDEVLPFTVLDELQPLGAMTVTTDEAAWLNPELNATFGGHPDFKEEHCWEEMRVVLRRCKDCFANTPHDLKGYTGEATHNTFSIPFKDESKAVYQRPRKYSPGEQEIIDIHCKELLEYGFIEPASKHCRHASDVVVAGKKDHASGLWTQTRFCVDLRGINRHSLKDNTLPHRPKELIYQKMAKAKFKTTLDATKAFHQIPMATEEDRDKTAFWWTNQLYRYTSMPFGAAGATAAFVSEDNGLRAAPPTALYGGAIQDLPKPQDKTGLRSILGMMKYYKGLVGEPGGPNYSEMARPFNDLLKKEIADIKGAWGKEQGQALQDLKDALCAGRCLRPIDYDRPFILHTDWSTYGIGAVLGQRDDRGEEYICMSISRSLSKTERQYASFKGEMPAVVWAVRTLRQCSVGEFCEKRFCDSLCFALAGDPPIGVEATPEVQVAKYCKMVAREQLGTGPVHRLFDLHSLYSSEHFEDETILKPEKVNTRVLEKQFFSRAREEGVVCYEPCGGLCAGLEMLLRSGVKVTRYLCQDISASSQAVVRARCAALVRRYPDLLSPDAVELEVLPSDLRATTVVDFVRAGALQGQQWIMGSRAFRAPRLGTVVRSAGVDSEEEAREVNLDEKSRAMCYSASELLMADGLSDEELASVLGLAMDRRAMELLLAVAEASRKGLPHSEESPVAENSPGQPIAVDNNWADHARSDPQQRHALLAKWVGISDAYTHSAGDKGHESPRLGGEVADHVLTRAKACARTQHADWDTHRDIPDDEWCLRCLKSNGSVELPEAEARRVKRRAARHRWDEATDEIYMITLCDMWG
eukprot:gene34190-biopygen18940